MCKSSFSTGINSGGIYRICPANQLCGAIGGYAAFAATGIFASPPLGYGLTALEGALIINDCLNYRYNAPPLKSANDNGNGLLRIDYEYNMDGVCMGNTVYVEWTGEWGSYPNVHLPYTYR